MNVKIDIDMTPEEMRRLMGLPDVQPFHDELVEKLREQFRAGAEGYDPLALLQPYMNSAVNSMETLQRFMSGVMGAGAGKQPDEKS